MVKLVEQLESDLPDGMLRQLLTEVQQSIQITEALILEVRHDIDPSAIVKCVTEQLCKLFVIDLLDKVYSLLSVGQLAMFEWHALYKPFFFPLIHETFLQTFSSDMPTFIFDAEIAFEQASISTENQALDLEFSDKLFHFFE